MAASVLHDAWGGVRAYAGSGHGRYLYTGAEAEGVASLYHMGARFYAPTLGRWLSEEPVQDKPFEPESLNFYAYVNNNPTLFVDPDGQIAVLPILAGAWILAELGLTVSDIYIAARTLQSKASAAEKAIAVGIAVLGVLGPGGGWGQAKGITTRFVSAGRHLGFIRQVEHYTDAQLMRSFSSFSRSIAGHRERLRAADAAANGRLAAWLRKEIQLYEEQLAIVMEEMLNRGIVRSP